MLTGPYLIATRSVVAIELASGWVTSQDESLKVGSRVESFHFLIE
jgi:hypothetical protein